MLRDKGISTLHLKRMQTLRCARNPHSYEIDPQSTIQWKKSRTNHFSQPLVKLDTQVSCRGLVQLGDVIQGLPS